METIRIAALASLLWLLAGFAAPGAPVRIAERGANADAPWDQRATATINLPPSPAGTPEERRPVHSLDMATLHLAILRALRRAPAESQEAAAGGTLTR